MWPCDRNSASLPGYSNLFGSRFNQAAVGFLSLRRNMAGIVQQFFPICQITTFFVDLVSENYKPLSSISPSQPDNHERAIAHPSRCIWQSFRQKSEWIVRAKVVARYPPCNVPVPN